ncbi:MAG: YeeE/YedE family protein [Burkholderiales bacterium]|nr:YeeE/YedE family protein [Burkholderiales bacterium]
MSAIEVAAQTQQVLWSAFMLASVFGALAQITHFCTMGAIADVYSMGDWRRARMWLLAVGVAMIGFGVMAGRGVIDPAATFYSSPRLLWASALVGGLMFGAGMVLASGCGSKTLVRIGGGNLKSLVVLIVMGVAAAATLRGLTAVWRTNTIDLLMVELVTRQDLPSLLAPALGVAKTDLSLVLGLGLGLALCTASLLRSGGDKREMALAGAGVGVLVTAMWWVSGHLGFVPEHPETLEATYLASNTRAMEAFSFVAPAAALLNWLTWFSDSSQVLNLAVVLPLGVVLGSAAAALARGEFRWEGFAGPADTARHLGGAVLMGVGGVTAMGCTIGQGLSGLSTLSLGSALATAGIVAGAVVALRWQMWQLERQA